MTAAQLAPLAALGVWHGLNPGMGWLFAVALGMQEGRGRAVWRALIPLAVGHALAVVAALAVAAILGVVLPAGATKWVVAAALVAFALQRALRMRHPRYGGMRVNTRQLATWSFLMATAHGAGLMVIPFTMAGHHGLGASVASAHASHATVSATAAHTAGYLFVTGLIAVLVFHFVGLAALRRAWVNLDAVWSVALLVTAVGCVVWG